MVRQSELIRNQSRKLRKAPPPELPCTATCCTVAQHFSVCEASRLCPATASLCKSRLSQHAPPPAPLRVVTKEAQSQSGPQEASRHPQGTAGGPATHEASAAPHTSTRPRAPTGQAPQLQRLDAIREIPFHNVLSKPPGHDSRNASPSTGSACSAAQSCHAPKTDPAT